MNDPKLISKIDKATKVALAKPQKGDLVYIKAAQRGLLGGARPHIFQDYGVALLIGQTDKEISPVQMFRVLGACGLITFDDVGEFLGEELAKKCIEAFENKYYGKVLEKLKEEMTKEGADESRQ